MRYAIRWFKCKLKPPKKSTAAPLTYKESILVSKKSFHQLITGKKKRLDDDGDNDETGDMGWKRRTNKKIAWDDDNDNGLPKGEADLLPRSLDHTSSSSPANMGQTSRRKQRRNNKSVSELMSMLPARPDRATHCFIAWLSTVGADRIDWDEDTFQLIIDGVCKITAAWSTSSHFLKMKSQ